MERDGSPISKGFRKFLSKNQIEVKISHVPSTPEHPASSLTKRQERRLQLQKKRILRSARQRDKIKKLEATIKRINNPSANLKKPGFYDSDEWKSLRYMAIKDHFRVFGRRCLVCGRNGSDIIFHVDYIKPRSKYPELALVLQNLQVLCADCNIGKSNTDEIDWRVPF